MIAAGLVALAVVASAVSVDSAGPYYGRKVGSWRNATFGLTGDVYLVNRTHIQVVAFSLRAPREPLDLAVLFSMPSGVAKSNRVYQVVRAKTGLYSKPISLQLDRGFNNARFIFEIPQQLEKWEWIGVASEKKWFFLAATSLKGAKAPAPFCCITSSEDQRKGIVGTWYNAGTGPIEVLDAKTLKLPRFTFQGNKPPDGWLFAGNGVVKRESGKKALVMGRDTKELHCPMREHYGGDKDLTVRLGDGQNVYNVDYLSVYCFAVGIDFGHVRLALPKGTHVPPFVPPVSRHPLHPGISKWTRPIVAIVPQDSRSVIEGLTFTVGEVGGAKARAMRSICESQSAAWYANDALTPEVWVERGRTYRIKVQGGHDRPLYITSETTGGYSLKPADEKRIITNFAGDDARATGSSCAWKSKAKNDPDVYSSFLAWRQAELTQVCSGNEAGTLIWSVRQSTPDLVYYGSFNHYNMGGPIRVCNKLTGTNSNPICQ